MARAIERSPLPVVCGVGHEIDVTIADLVADLRAPTPSAAAELALPDRGALRDALTRDWRRLRHAGHGLLARRRAALERERDALKALAPTARLAAQRARWLSLARALRRAAEASAERGRSRLRERAGRLDSLSPLGVLGRGYALVRRDRDGVIVRGVGDVERDDRLAIRVASAELEAVVASVRPLGKSRNPL